MSTLQGNCKVALAAVIASVLTVLPAWSANSSPETADIVVHVRNVVPQGTIRLGLYTEASYPDDDAVPVASADLPAQAGETIIELRNVPPGTYAIETYQDLNNNGKWILPSSEFQRNLMAFPVMPDRACPNPASTASNFVVSAGRNEQTLHLQNVRTPVATK